MGRGGMTYAACAMIDCSPQNGKCPKLHFSLSWRTRLSNVRSLQILIHVCLRGDSHGWLIFISQGGKKSNTLSWFGSAPFCRNIWQTSIYMQIAVEVGVAALLCWLHLSYTKAFWSFLIDKIVQLNWQQDIVRCNRSTPLYRQEGLSIGIYFHTSTLAFCSPVTVKAIGFISVNCSTRTFFNYVSVCVTS